jgi:hypothetical protein
MAPPFLIHTTGSPWIFGLENALVLWMTRKQILHALAASCLQSPQFFASMLPEQFFELIIEDAIKKAKNLRDTCPQ